MAMATTITASTARLPSFRNSAAPAPASVGNNGYDLKACLEILKKLAPKVSPDLPTLSSSSSSSLSSSSFGSNNVTAAAAARGNSSDLKRKHEDGTSQDRKETDTKRPRTHRQNSSSSSASASAASPSASESDATTRASKRPSVAGAPSSSSATSRKNGTSAISSKGPDLQNSHVGSNADASTSTSAHKRSRSNGSIVSLADLKARSSASSSSKKEGKVLAPLEEDSAQRRSATSNAASTTTTSGQAASSPTLPSTAVASHSHAAAASPQTTINHHHLHKQGKTKQGEIWTRERFKRIAAICREKGRALKHSGDKRMREYSAPSSSSTSGPSSATAAASANRHVTPIVALFEQIDAVILYAYAFWCEDQAAGHARNRQSSNSSVGVASPPGGPASGTTLAASSSSASAIAAAASSPSSSNWKQGCIAENWKSIFGLVAFVRGRAEKLSSSSSSSAGINSAKVGKRIARALPRAMEIVVAWMNMLEALILQHLTTNSSRLLNSQASRLLSSTSGGAANGLSPVDSATQAVNDNESIVSANSSASAMATAPPEATNNFLQSYLKLQADLEKIHTLWPTSQNILLHPENSCLPGDGGGNHDGNDDHGHDDDEEEEDLLSLVLRKGRMAYDLEPTRLDDIVMPNLPRDEDDLGDDDEHDGENNNKLEDSNVDGDGKDVDAEGEPDISASTPTMGSSTNTNLSLRSTGGGGAHMKRKTSSGAGGPASPEDLFKDEENYFRFSWPIIMHHQNAVAHTTSFGRALLFEMAARMGINYTPPDITPSSRRS